MVCLSPTVMGGPLSDPADSLYPTPIQILLQGFSATQKKQGQAASSGGKRRVMEFLLLPPTAKNQGEACAADTSVQLVLLCCVPSAQGRTMRTQAQMFTEALSRGYRREQN